MSVLQAVSGPIMLAVGVGVTLLIIHWQDKSAG